MSDAERRSGTSFKVLKRRDFSIFWTAAFISNTGSWMQTIAVPFVVYQMTHSTTWLGIAAFGSFIPGMISGPFGGSYADRHSRKRILVVTQTLMMTSAFALWAVYVSGAATPGIIVGITCVTGFVGGVNITTWQAFVTQLVDEDEIVDAVRLNSMQFMGARAIGPAIAGVILQTMGASAAFFLNAISFVLVLVALFLIHPRQQVFSEDSGHVLAHLREGWRFVRAHTAVALPIVMIGMVSLLGTSVIQLAPAMAKEEFHVGRGAYGLLVAAFGGGAITGSVAIALIADRYRRSFTATIGGIGIAIGVIGLGLAPKYALGVAAMYVMGLTYLLLATSLNTAVQARVEDEYRARVMAIYLSSLLLGVPLGALIEGKLASLTDLRVVIVGAGVLFGVFMAYVWARYRRLAPLDEDLIPMATDPLLQGQPMIAGAD
jgi:MFS family permease